MSNAKRTPGTSLKSIYAQLASITIVFGLMFGTMALPEPALTIVCVAALALLPMIIKLAS